MDTLDFLSDSSTDSSSSESDNEENLDDQTFQAAFQEQIAQKASASTAPSQEIPKITDVAPNFTSINTATTTNLTSINTATTSNNVTTSSIFPLTKPKKVKKRPPAPDDFSKLLGIPINEAPKKKIKKLSGVSADREKRAKELEDKYSWYVYLYHLGEEEEEDVVYIIMSIIYNFFKYLNKVFNLYIELLKQLICSVHNILSTSDSYENCAIKRTLLLSNIF